MIDDDEGQGQQPDYESLAKKYGGTVSGSAADDPRKRAPAPEPSAVGQAGSVFRDLTMGAAKGLGRTGLDISRAFLGVMNPAMIPTLTSGEYSGTPHVLESTNTAERLGGLASDVATTALPGGSAARGSRMAANLANRIERHAVPEFTAAMADQALSRGVGRVTAGSAKALAKEARATPTLSTTMVQRAGKWVPRSRGPSKLQPAAEAMAVAAARKAKPVTVGEAAAVLGGGTIGGSMVGMPVAGALIGGSKLLGRPLPSSAIAQLLYNAGPTIQGVLGGAGAMGVREALAALLSSGSDQGKR